MRSLVFFLVFFILKCNVAADIFYRDNAKDVVIDKERHLMWQDNTAAGEVKKNYTDAIAYCENLNFVGYDDWYLPSVDELKSIVKAENYPKSIVEGFNNVSPSYYWSSSEYTSEYAWIVLFIYEDVVYYHKTDKSYVRCLRKVKK